MRREYRHIEKSFTTVPRISLTEAEREGMRAALLQVARLSRAVDPERSRRESRGENPHTVLVSQARRFRMPRIALKPAAAFAMVLLLLSSGVSYAAESALPGEPLYPVKVSVNEEVRAALTFDAEARAVWEAERALRRLEEAEALAAKNELDAVTRAEAERRFTRAAQAAEAKAEVFETEGNHAAAARVHALLEGGLAAHEEVLSGLSGRVDGEASAVLNTVRQRRESVAERRANAEASADSQADRQADTRAQASVQATRRVAERRIASAQSALVRSETRLTAAVRAEAETQIRAAEAAVVEGNAAVDAGMYARANRLFTEAQRIARHVEILITSSVRFDLKVDLIVPPPRFLERENRGGEDDRRPDAALPRESRIEATVDWRRDGRDGGDTRDQDRNDDARWNDDRDREGIGTRFYERLNVRFGR